jgi:Fe-S oxidoreductase
VWARIASRAPRLVNLALHAPIVSRALKAAAGIAPARAVPRCAAEPFQRWFARRPQRRSGGRRVILWPDTFNNYFHPGTARAAVEVLEAAGYSVAVPRSHVCCGRPLYDYGMLDTARKLLRGTLDMLRDDLSGGTPIVCLEPSCASVFRDELIGLMPNDEDARRLAAQTTTLSELLARDGFSLPHLARKAKLHGHCHEKALWGTDAEREMLQRAGVDAEVLDSGCCGLAGSFGYEKGHYDVSMKIGERVLLPAVRSAPADELIVADGFSCRSQIEQGTGRRALHIAEVLQLALRRDRTVGAYPEGAMRDGRARKTRRKVVVAAALVAGAGYLAWRGSAPLKRIGSAI